MPELGEGLVTWQGAQAGGVPAAVERGEGYGAEPFGFAAGQPGKGAEPGEAGRRGKGVEYPAAEGDWLAELLGHPGLDGGGLADGAGRFGLLLGAIGLSAGFGPLALQ